MSRATLSEADKKRIEEEERYRKKVRDKLRGKERKESKVQEKEKEKKKSKGCLILILIVIGFFILIGLIGDGDEKKIEETPQPSPTIKATPTPTPPLLSTPTPEPSPEAKITPTPGGYTCDCSKTCPQMSSCEEAYYQLNICGCSIRDGDKDGVPCEIICPGG